jgi:hypothetical protein
MSLPTRANPAAALGTALLLTFGAATGITIAAEPAHTQARPRAGYAGFVAAGVSAVATGELDDRLAASGHPTFGSRPVALNVGAYRLFRSGVMLGAEWHYLNVGDGEHQGRAVGLGAGYATLGLGYAVALSPRVRFYPRLGLGVGGMGLWSEVERDVGSGANDFAGWLANPTTDPDYATLSQASMVVDLGAGVELLLRGRGGGGPLLGLRSGYVVTPFDQGWTQDGRSVSGAPDATVAGPYVRAVIGWRLER